MRELLEIEGLEAVIVCAETDRHEELIEQVAKARKHCFAEKPLGLGKADSERMQKALEDAGVLFQTGYFNRSKAAYRKIKELVEFYQIYRFSPFPPDWGPLGCCH